MTTDEKVKRLKEVNAQICNLTNEKEGLERELTKHTSSIRKLFQQRVEEFLEPMKDIEGYRISFNYYERSYGGCSAEYSLSATKLSEPGNVYSRYNGERISLNRHFLKKTPTTEKIINTKFREIEREFKKFCGHHPNFKHELDKRKLLLKLKDL